MKSKILCASLCLMAAALFGADQLSRFDAAPFGVALPEGNGVLWDDPREIHEVRIQFQSAPPAQLRLEYWGSHWPNEHLPKDKEPGGGDVGWMELGNWYKGGWRTADSDCKIDGNTAVFTFRPVNAKEFPKLKNYAASFRYTLKVRVGADQPLPRIEKIETFTDSALAARIVTLAWKQQPATAPTVTVFNGSFLKMDEAGPLSSSLCINCVTNRDPNTFDRTLVTVHNAGRDFTFKLDDLEQGPLFLPEFGVAVLKAGDTRDYAALAKETQGRKTLYETVGEMPEQTWKSAWEGLPAKKSRICVPLGLDGGRQKYRLDANGTVSFRWGEQYIKGLPGHDTPRLAVEKDPVIVEFGFGEPVDRHLDQDCLPICTTTWRKGEIRIDQTAFATELGGTQSEDAPPAADAFAVSMLRFSFKNESQAAQDFTLPMKFSGGEKYDKLRVDNRGLIWNGDKVRGQISTAVAGQGNTIKVTVSVPAGESKTIVVKLPYLPLTNSVELDELAALDFEREHARVAKYWEKAINRGARLITPEPVLDTFYRAMPGHLLINSELEPGAARRFARVGSFSYGAYGNESCMMVVDMDRRGYHREAAECLEAWLHYQGSVELPGDFSSHDGVLYGAGSYESGGYNQHHGWILWMMAEHYRFTRDDAWLRHAIPGMIKGADWIINETKRTASRNDLSRGLLPAGSLEDIGDWWTWLSTSCYSWRGLDSAAWALEAVNHPEAARIRAAADEYHKNLIANFTAASARSPVVRLRDGTAVPQIPSYVQRRGRSFGWICQTLEGSLHLLITGAMDPNSQAATWIVKDYEDNLFLSNQYGYTLDNFDKYWFGRGGMSMQACLLLDVEPYLYRDDVKQALRAMFNAIAVSHFPDVHMNTEHALPEMGDWRGDHYKSSDESNASGWLRFLFIREQGNELLLGQAVPREWLRNGQKCGLERGATYFGQCSVVYQGGENQITATVDAPTRNAPSTIRLRFREPNSRPIQSVSVNGKQWTDFKGEWVQLPGNIAKATVTAQFAK